MMNKLDGTVGFIGGGNMAGAFIHGLLDAGVCLASDVCVSDVRKERIDEIERLYAVGVTGLNPECAKRSDVIILSVKPQNMPGLLKELSGLSLGGKLVISIAAGVTIGLIERSLRGRVAVVRAMPNTPALVGEAISVWARGKCVTERDAERAGLILGALGRELEVAEDLIDAATALSGSGPAYVFYLLEAMASAGEEMGFTYAQALSVSIQTVLGAARLARESGNSPHELRRRVTSPGGTTACAMKVLKARRVRESIVEAIKAARSRARELSEESGK